MVVGADYGDGEAEWEKRRESRGCFQLKWPNDRESHKGVDASGSKIELRYYKHPASTAR